MNLIGTLPTYQILDRRSGRGKGRVVGYVYNLRVAMTIIMEHEETGFEIRKCNRLIYIEGEFGVSARTDLMAAMRIAIRREKRKSPVYLPR